MARDESFRTVVEQVRNVFQTCWRASSLVEGINSVVRMQQARHRRLTAGLIDLKRFYWNCREVRTGRRKGHAPYELLGIKLPTDDWWGAAQLAPRPVEATFVRAVAYDLGKSHSFHRPTLRRSFTLKRRSVRFVGRRM